jgi:hypothetical protein
MERHYCFATKSTCQGVEEVMGSISDQKDPMRIPADVKFVLL